MISEIGVNDLVDAYSEGLTPSQAINFTVPRAIKAVRNAVEVSNTITTNLEMHLMPLLRESATHTNSISVRANMKNCFPAGFWKWNILKAVDVLVMNFEPYSACTQALYAGGSRRFLVFNAPPAGCTPYILTLYGEKGGPVDRLGCLSEYNEAVRVYNAQLKASVKEFRTRFSDASILFFDTYGATEAVFSDLERYGMNQIKQNFLYLHMKTQSRHLPCAAHNYSRI